MLVFEHNYDDELRKSLVGHWSSLQTAGKLVVARANMSIRDAACRWVEDNPETFQPSGTWEINSAEIRLLILCDLLPPRPVLPTLLRRR